MRGCLRGFASTVCAILQFERRQSEGPGTFLGKNPGPSACSRIRARSPCLYARNPRRCPVLRAGCMRASEKTYRLYSCGRCAQQVRICSDCDRGNRYCAGECARVRRRESLRRAAERYQLSYRGACRHAARQRAWRARHAQKVTHQGSLPTAVTFIVGSDSTRTTTEGTYADIASVEPQPHATLLDLAARRAHWPIHHLALSEPRCCFCGHTLPRFARLGPLRARP